MAMQSPALLAFRLLQLGLDAPVLSPWEFMILVSATDMFCYFVAVAIVCDSAIAGSSSCQRLLALLSAGESTDILLGAALSPASVSLRHIRPAIKIKHVHVRPQSAACFQLQ